MILCELIERKEFKCQKGVHPYDALLIVLEGKFVCSFGEKAYTASKNDVFVFHNNTPFERKVIEPLRCIYIQFHSFPFQIENGILKLSDLYRAESTISLLERAITEEDQIRITHYINDLILLRQPSQALHQTRTCAVVANCIKFMNENYECAITLDSLAGRFYISKQWLISKFKDETQKTPMEYLNNIRMRQAQNLLKHTDLPIGEIAVRCGFENIYYFSNAFKKSTALSPKEYRKNLQL